MYIYRSTRRFFCTPLKRYIPAGAHVARYENAVRIVIDEAPASDQDPFNVLVDGITYNDPADVTWLYGIEPAPLGTVSGHFTVLATKDEDSYGNVSATAGGGLPANSTLQIETATGNTFFQNATTGLWHQVRVDGPDGNVYFEIDQTGVVL